MLVAPHRRRFFNAAAESGDPYWANVSLLLHCDGADASTTFTDSSSYAHTVTANGDAQIDTAQSKFGGASALFDGTGDYLAIPDHTSFDLGTGDFSVEFWIYISAITNNMIIIGQPGAAWGATDWGIITQYSGGSHRLQFRDSGTYHNKSTYTISGSAWHFCSVIRSGTTLTINVDGVEDYSGTCSSSFTNANDIMVGGNTFGYNAFSGAIDDMRLTKGVARGITPPTAAFPDS